MIRFIKRPGEVQSPEQAAYQQKKARSITAVFLSLQTQLAAFLNKRVNKCTKNRLVIALVIYILICSGICLYILINTLIN